MLGEFSIKKNAFPALNFPDSIIISATSFNESIFYRKIPEVKRFSNLIAKYQAKSHRRQEDPTVYNQ
jgi:hypothetical protein